MSVVCEEIFDETSHPSIEEIRDYATKIGIDPDSEPQLLPLAAEGLMKALPPGWKPCYDDKRKSYYYYNNLTGKTQWEHPLDDVYRGLVKKVRAESQSLSLGEPTEDATYARDEIPSFEEPPKFELQGAKKRDAKLAPLKFESKLLKQRSEENLLGNNRKIGLNIFSTSFDEKIDNFERHPRSIEKTELKISGGGAMFLKSNTINKKNADAKSEFNSLDLQAGQPRSILRERNSLEVSKSLEFDKISLDKSEKDDDDKKSVRFNLDNTTDVAFTFSDKSSSDEDDINSEKNKPDIINIKITQNKTKSRFTTSTPLENEAENSNNTNLKLIKPNPGDFIKPKLTVSKSSDSDDDSLIKSTDKRDSSEENSLDIKMLLKHKKLEEKAEKKIAQMKQNIWEEKNDELVKFNDDLQESHKEELERILISAKTQHEERIKSELENLRIEMENRNAGALIDEKTKFQEKLEEERLKLQKNFEDEERKMKENFDNKKDELEKYYDDKLAEIEKELAERMERSRDELIITHNSDLDQLKQNHSIILEELKKSFQAEEDELRKKHKAVIFDIKNKSLSDVESGDQKKNDDKPYEKLKYEKKLLEDKYKCLKEKYIRLKSDVKMSIEKRNKRKEQSGATTATTTGSETERSHSNNNNKDRTPLNSPLRKPPTPKQNLQRQNNNKPENKSTRLITQEVDTSFSDRSEEKHIKNDYDSSDNSLNPGRSRKKLFSRLKSSSTSRINNTSKSARRNNQQQRSCSPVENLRRQLQKLEDLEDQFPQNAASDTYHLRYPFSDGQKFEGSSELEFFRHRIHLERDSIKRAKESLRSQKSLFQQRQKELKLKHGTMARHTLQQLCQEEKELTDMEVSLHRTRSLLGEKVIRLRHLEQSLQRASVPNNENRQEDATLSDLSSHSASSGISSTEFATADATFAKHLLQADHFQESSEIIQSLENLNSEIREIWDVLRKQQQSGGIATVIPPIVYPDLGWPLLAGAAAVPAPPSIPTLADRLHNYRQHVALANAQSTMVTHAANQGAMTTLVERTKNLRHWLRQAGIDANAESGAPQATL